jgi:phage repressor protein C with HTH and peptisase S24 domain
MEAGDLIDFEEVIRFSVPGYSTPLSAGTGQEAGQEYPENYKLIKEPPRGTSFIARVSGISMEPTYHDSDLVFVHATEEIPVGHIGAFYMAGQQWIKELGDGVLISHNPGYDPIPMRDDIRCQGLVLGVCDESYFE